MLQEVGAGLATQGLREDAVAGVQRAGLTGLRAQSAVFLVHTEVSGRLGHPSDEDMSRGTPA